MSDEGERALRHAVRGRVVLRYLGELGLVLGVAAMIPTLGAALLGEFDLLLPYGAVGGLLWGLGLLARRGPAPRDLQRNEALVVTVAAFVLSPVVMSVPLAIQGIPWIDALFEAISGFTTTGLSTLASVEHSPRTFLLARAWMQWIGGLGFVVLSVGLVLEPGAATRRLGAAGLDPSDVAGGMRAHARRLLLIYLGLSGFGVLLLVALGATTFDAVVHTFAGVSTGGFAPRDSSLAALSRRLQCAVLGLSLLGAVSLPLYAELWRGGWRRFRDDPQLRTLLLLTATAMLALVALQRGDGAGSRSLPDLALLAVSAQTTAGFSTLAPDGLSDAAKAILILSMITGGSLGSTAGGMKLLRILVAIRLVRWLITRTRLPAHAVSAPSLAGERLEAGEVLRETAVILLFLLVVLVSWIPFLAYGYEPLGALFEVASATGTVGLSAEVARPDLEPVLKGLLCVNMLLGRLEVFAVLVALSPRTWIGRRRS